MKMNANVRVLGRLSGHKFPWQEKVIDKDLSTPPGSPSAGDRYIVGAAATGAWVGLENDIVEFIGASWDVVWDSSVEGDGAKVFVADEGSFYEYNSSSWAAEASSSVSELNDLSDVTLAGLADAHIMIFDNSLGDFENKALSGDISITKEGVATVDHDTITNFVANEHIDHTSVTLTAGAGLSGGGDISASRTFDLDLNELSVAAIAAGDFLPFVDIDDSNNGKKITFANLEAALNHDSLAGFVANEHIDHSAVTLTAGVGLSGGGDITASRTFDLADTAVTPAAYGDAQNVATFTVDQQGRLTAAGTTTIDDTTKIPLSQKGAANGVATLDGSGKLPSAQLPASAMEYKGAWNADTNTPTLANGTGDVGDLYKVSVSGSTDFGAGAIAFVAGDAVIYNGTIWEKIPGEDIIQSVNGATGVVVLDTDDIAEGTALYHTDERAQDAVGNILTDGNTVDFTYDDGANTITAEVILDGATLSSSASGLKIADGGVDTTQLADDAVSKAKLAAGVLGRFSTATHAAGTAVAINHALGLAAASAVHVSLFEIATGEQVLCDSITFTDGNNLTLNFASSVGSNSLRINISSAEDIA